jgi:hypothetical protein
MIERRLRGRAARDLEVDRAQPIGGRMLMLLVRAGERRDRRERSEASGGQRETEQDAYARREGHRRTSRVANDYRVARASLSHGAIKHQAKHFFYAAGWKKFEPPGSIPTSGFVRTASSRSPSSGRFLS